MRSPSERDAILGRVAAKLENTPTGRLTLRQAYDLLNEIERDVCDAEDDPLLYNALMTVRSHLKEAMQIRADELGESNGWTHAMKLHDARLLLNPLFRARDNEGDYIRIYRAMSEEQIAALKFLEEVGRVELPRPEHLQKSAVRGRFHSLIRSLFVRDK